LAKAKYMIIMQLISADENRKIFRSEDEVDLIINKSFDEGENGNPDIHGIVVFVPKIEELNVSNLMNPVGFPDEKSRNDAFDSFEEVHAGDFLSRLINHILEQRKNTNDAENQSGEQAE